MATTSSEEPAPEKIPYKFLSCLASTILSISVTKSFEDGTALFGLRNAYLKAVKETLARGELKALQVMTAEVWAHLKGEFMDAEEMLVKLREPLETICSSVFLRLKLFIRHKDIKHLSETIDEIEAHVKEEKCNDLPVCTDCTLYCVVHSHLHPHRDSKFTPKPKRTSMAIRTCVASDLLTPAQPIRAYPILVIPGEKTYMVPKAPISLSLSEFLVLANNFAAYNRQAEDLTRGTLPASTFGDTRLFRNLQRFNSSMTTSAASASVDNGPLLEAFNYRFLLAYVDSELPLDAKDMFVVAKRLAPPPLFGPEANPSGPHDWFNSISNVDEWSKEDQKLLRNESLPMMILQDFIDVIQSPCGSDGEFSLGMKVHSATWELIIQPALVDPGRSAIGTHEVVKRTLPSHSVMFPGLSTKSGKTLSFASPLLATPVTEKKRPSPVAGSPSVEPSLKKQKLPPTPPVISMPSVTKTSSVAEIQEKVRQKAAAALFQHRNLAILPKAPVTALQVPKVTTIVMKKSIQPLIPFSPTTMPPLESDEEEET